jgi:hypothetical protein
MGHAMVVLEKVELPSFGGEDEALPPLNVQEYQRRLAAATDRMRAIDLDTLAVYADREHLANMAFLTGFDPRFEEALLLLDGRGNRALLVGNECMGYLPDAALECKPLLFQEFSLMGQPRGESPPLRQILADFGIGRSTRVGCVGWKHIASQRLGGPADAIEIPSYIVDLLRDLVGPAGRVCNANHLLMAPQDGLRVSNCADQIARFEYAAVRTSQSVLAVLRHIREGTSEEELSRHLYGASLPQSCHPMISFGEKAARGLSSPSGNRARRGDPFVVAYGVWGALNCRAGMVAESAGELAGPLREFYPRFAANYFGVVARWYESVKVGAAGSEVFAAVEDARDIGCFALAVNPGHYIHIDEWVHSPFTLDSSVVLRSGMALQMDIIPVSAGPFCYTNAEDGIVLADEPLRAELASRHPSAWKRMTARRAFMREVLGIRLDESVLPLGNMPGWLPPYALDLGKALVYAG